MEKRLVDRADIMIYKLQKGRVRRRAYTAVVSWALRFGRGGPSTRGSMGPVGFTFGL